jgi:tryptophanyl-tRNA synthetase
MFGGAPFRERHGTSCPKTNLAAVFRQALVPFLATILLHGCSQNGETRHAGKPGNAAGKTAIQTSCADGKSPDRRAPSWPPSRAGSLFNARTAILPDCRRPGLTDNASDPGRIRRNILEVALDYLAVGIDPAETTICIQSALPALSDLTLLYLNYVTVARLERNPTIKDEIMARGFGRDIPAGFLCYPVAQAADITGFKATVVPVGDDQVPIIEQTNEIVRRICRQAGRDVLPEATAVVPVVGRLPDLDGFAKMSKSQGNAIQLSAAPDQIRQAIRRMNTDPNHLKISDPGRVEGNVVFTYLDAFDEDAEAVEALKRRYRRGGLGDTAVKKRLEDVLQTLIAPVRERRAIFAERPDDVLDIIRSGTATSRSLSE